MLGALGRHADLDTPEPSSRPEWRIKLPSWWMRSGSWSSSTGITEALKRRPWWFIAVNAAPVQPARRKEPAPLDVKTRGKPVRKLLFTAERMKTQRARLGFTKEMMVELLEVSSLSIWKRESGGAVPRASRVPKILQRLALGKREALASVSVD